MTHPNEPPTHSRREFLRRAAAAGIVLPSMGAILAACRDSSTDTGGPSPSTGEGGIALATPDTPVTLPLYDDIPAIDDGLSQEAGPLRIYNWNDYIYKKVIKQFKSEFGVEVE
jgi:spermidine/putrescine-binding protein